jgi:hypothetical protein
VAVVAAHDLDQILAAFDSGFESGVVHGGWGGGCLPGQRRGAKAEGGQRQEGLVDHLGCSGRGIRAFRAVDPRLAVQTLTDEGRPAILNAS